MKRIDVRNSSDQYLKVVNPGSDPQQGRIQTGTSPIMSDINNADG